MFLLAARVWTPDNDPTKQADSLAKSPAAIVFFVLFLAFVIALAWMMVRARRARRQGRIRNGAAPDRKRRDIRRTRSA